VGGLDCEEKRGRGGRLQNSQEEDWLGLGFGAGALVGLLLGRRLGLALAWPVGVSFPFFFIKRFLFYFSVCFKSYL
jgi:hypothetical protein